MAHALNNASHTSAANELGIAVGTNRTQTSLTRYAGMNKWSFYRSGSIAPNATTKLMQLTAPSNNDKLGDFRGYNNSANVPTTPADFNRYWGPGGTTISLTFVTYVEEWNLRETTSGSVPYISVRYYLSSTNRTNKTGAVRTYTVAAAETTNTPPTGHTNNQTQRPASASQIVTDGSFPTSLITTPNDIVYADIYISNSGGTEIARFGAAQSDGWVTVSTYENTLPFITAGGNFSPTPASQTAAFPLVYTSSSTCSDTDIVKAIGGSTLQFYVNAKSVGFLGGRVYNLTNVTCTVVYDGASKTLFTGSIGTTKRYVNSTLPTGKSWAYNKVAVINLSSPTWGTSWISCP